MTTIKPGQPAPDVPLQTIDGDSLQLSQAWNQGQHTLLIFLRHLAWLPWKAYAVQVEPYYHQIKALNTNIIAISFGTEYWARAWLSETQAPFPLWLDPGGHAYRAFGLESSLQRSWGWNNLRYYIQAIWRGERVPEYRGNTNQLGGNFIVDKHGLVQFAYPSHDPTDRPAIEDMLTVLRQLT